MATNMVSVTSVYLPWVSLLHSRLSANHSPPLDICSTHEATPLLWNIKTTCFNVGWLSLITLGSQWNLSVCQPLKIREIFLNYIFYIFFLLFSFDSTPTFCILSFPNCLSNFRIFFSPVFLFSLYFLEDFLNFIL